MNLAMLEKAVPGVPGEDYPIFAEVPDSGFSCDGQVEGGYYADPEADCQGSNLKFFDNFDLCQILVICSSSFA